MRCPQCGTETPDEEWNCVSCRVNLYWAHQHYRELAQLRQEQGLSSSPRTPSFLIASHQSAQRERAARGDQADNKVRSIARRVMRGETASAAHEPAQPE